MQSTSKTPKWKLQITAQVKLQSENLSRKISKEQLTCQELSKETYQVKKPFKLSSEYLSSEQPSQTLKWITLTGHLSSEQPSRTLKWKLEQT